MICFAKPELTEDFYIVQKKEFSITCYMCDTCTRRKAKHILRDKPISSERILHKDVAAKVQLKKITLVVILEGLGLQNELIGGRKVTDWRS
jgi:hypothetical protein